MKLRDLLWVLAYPLYQIIGTFRHEGAHALVAILEGREISKFVFWPSTYNGQFYWGYVVYEGATSLLSSAAPYILDLITFVFFLPLCALFLFKRKWIWINLIAIGLISPFANSLYNYKGRLSSLNDVWKMFQDLPDMLVHGYFLITLLIYLIGIIIAFGFSRTARYYKKPKKNLLD